VAKLRDILGTASICTIGVVVTKGFVNSFMLLFVWANVNSTRLKNNKQKRVKNLDGSEASEGVQPQVLNIKWFVIKFD
jgi:hypothetical protein